MQTYIRIILSILTISLSCYSFTQETKEKLRRQLANASFNEKFALGMDLMHDNIYGEAYYVWELMLEEDPTNANLNYKAGICLVKLNKEKDALPFFEKAQYAVVKNYNPYSPLERSAPPELFYYLANSSHTHGEIDTAIVQYQFFLDNVRKKHELYKSATLGITQCKVAHDLIAKPKGYVIENLGDKINSPAPEYSPVVTIDGSAIFFTAKKIRPDSSNARAINILNGQYFEDIYVSYRGQDGVWEDPIPLSFCDIRTNDASVTTSADGQVVFVYRDENGGDIFYSKIEDTSFLSIENFPAEELNTEYFEPHLTISADGENIYFVSDRPGGMGGLDIWRIRKLPNGEWSKAFNLGAPVNSEFDENSPFLGVDNKTLYFSSNGANSMGGYDIFVSQVDEEDTWSTPINMGYPLNTVDDDIFYTTTADGRIGFYSSDKLNGIGDKDIYMVQTETSYIKNVAIFTGFILTQDHSLIPDGITIYVKDLTDDSPEKKYTPRKRDGGYVLALKPCHTYHLDYRLDEETFYEDEIFVPCNSSYQEISHELLLDMVNLEASPLVNLPMKTQRWEFVGSSETDLLSGKTVKIFNGDNLVYQELINKYGQFNYKELDQKKSYLMKLEGVVGDLCEDLTVNLVDTANNILDTYIFNFDCTTKPSVSEFSDILTTPIYQYNFGYNKEDFDTKNQALILYVQGIKQVVDAGNEVKIIVSSSASKVPTRKFKSNYDLAQKRQETGIATITKVLKQYGVDMSKVTFVNGDAVVQGPDYNNDAESNKSVYQRYQYIRFEIQF